MSRPAVLVPLKAFRAGKSRLATGLGDGEREALVRNMADRVVAAARGLDVYVATDDEHVAGWATAEG
ncbi:MAG TPA: hypothetical protein VFV35_05070, partial [Acidimicrobiales bacterium]|nr:hypothetical protein [Acidimicrobiales bacterium]